MRKSGPNTVGFIRLTRWVLSLVRPYRGITLAVLAAMLLEVVTSLALPWPLKVIIDNVAGNKPLPHFMEPLRGYTENFSKMNLAAWAAIAMVGLTALGGLAGYVNAYLTETISQRMGFDLRQRIYHHLQHLSFSFYDNNQVGKLISTLTTDVNTIQDFATSTLLNIIIDLLTIMGMVVIMFSMNWDFSLIIVAVVPFIFFSMLRFRRSVKMITHEVRRDQSEMMATLHQGLETIRAVNAFGRQELEEQKLDRIGNRIIDHALHARRMKSLVSPLITLVVALCTAFVLYRGASLVLAHAMTIGALTVFITYLGKFFNPVKDLAKMTGSIATAMVSAERINMLLDRSEVMEDRPGAIEPKNIRGHIRFENIHFAYRKGNTVLDDVNLEILPGEHVGIVGPTGSGKSTLASLIPRFYEPQQGAIFLDGTNVANYSISGLRRQIAYVLQDTMLFYGTLRDNIAYGDPSATEEQITAAACAAQADGFIRDLPRGYDTIVGERGLTLSNGQRQRIGIARAILRNSPILILDEPTASLDSAAEKEVTEALQQLMQGRTVITITHRLSTVAHADRIFRVSNKSVTQVDSLVS